MAGDVCVRVATQYDEAAVLDVLRADGAATGRQPGKARLTAVRDDLRSPTALTLVADDGGEVVGALVARLGTAGPAGQLDLALVCVAPHRRRAGTGRALVAGLLDRFQTVSAWVSAPDTVALLRACGFRPSSESVEVDGVPTGRWVHP